MHLSTFQEQGEKDPVAIFRHIRDCIKFEMDLVRKAESGMGVGAASDAVMDNVNHISNRVEATSDILKQIVSEQSAFEIHSTEKQQLEGILDFNKIKLLICPEITFSVVYRTFNYSTKRREQSKPAGTFCPCA